MKRKDKERTNELAEGHAYKSLIKSLKIKT